MKPEADPRALDERRASRAAYRHAAKAERDARSADKAADWMAAREPERAAGLRAEAAALRQDASDWRAEGRAATARAGALESPVAGPPTLDERRAELEAEIARVQGVLADFAKHSEHITRAAFERLEAETAWRIADAAAELAGLGAVQPGVQGLGQQRDP